MAKIIAEFSNGYRDEYKGDRDVKAAWCIILPNGQVANSGHSRDRAAAEKTALGNLRYCDGHPPIVDKPGRSWSAASCAYFGNRARELGFKSWKEQYADYQQKAAAFRATCKIEIIDL